MKSLYILGLVALVFLIFWFLRGDWVLRPQYNKAVVSIGGEDFRVDVVDTPLKKAKGLGGREKLAPDEGMLFVFSPPSARTFWMKDMLIPIDIVWIKDGKVVGIEHNIDPEIDKPIYQKTRYPSPGKVDYVLEITGSTAEALEIEEGVDVNIRF